MILSFSGNHAKPLAGVRPVWRATSALFARGKIPGVNRAGIPGRHGALADDAEKDQGSVPQSCARGACLVAPINRGCRRHCRCG